MTDDIIRRLREAIAAGPTGGMWVATPKMTMPSSVCDVNDLEVCPADHRDPSHQAIDAHYIATASPANIAAIIAHVDAQAAEIERLRAGLQAVSDLIDESHGVAGLHRNGDVAPWSDLRAGGKYEAWLVSFDDALKEQR